MKKTKKYINLFLTMFKVGLFTFGGGYAMLSLLENEFVSRKKWIDKDEFLNMVAIAESTPGPVAINSSTYLGYRVGGVLGSIFATLGGVIPSFTIIYIISLFFDEFIELKHVHLAFKGIQICVIYLILTAGLKLLKNLEKTPFNIILTISIVLVMLITSLFAIKFSSIYYIIISGFIGLLYFSIKENLSKKGEKK